LNVSTADDKDGDDPRLAAVVDITPDGEEHSCVSSASGRG
jgi:hypothetical protein